MGERGRMGANMSAFIWTTQEGERIPVERMKSSHLFYTIRMIFNHSAPPVYQIPGCKRYALHMNARERRAALLFLVQELAKRPPQELKAWQWSQLQHMLEAVREIHRKRLTALCVIS